MEKLKQKTTPKIHQTESIGVCNSKRSLKTSLCVRIGPNSTHIYDFTHQKHLPEDERSFSRNVASLKNMIKDKTNCSFESIQHTESTNLNIFRKVYLGSSARLAYMHTAFYQIIYHKKAVIKDTILDLGELKKTTESITVHLHSC